MGTKFVILQFICFGLADLNLSVGGVVGAIIVCLGVPIVLRWIRHSSLNTFLAKRQINESHRKRIYSNIRYVVLLLGLLGVVLALNVNFELFEFRGFSFNVASVINVLLILQIARVLEVFIRQIQLNKDRPAGSDPIAQESLVMQDSKNRRLGTKTVQYMVVVFFIYLFLKSFSLDYTFFKVEGASLSITNILVFMLVILITRFVYWLTSQLFLVQYFRANRLDAGSQYAINQLAKYVIYVVGIYIAIVSVGLEAKLIWGGLAALLVGIGLGLQQTFNDLFSGIMLLTERTIEVGDFVQVEGLIGAVKHIGLRTSIVETRDNISVIVPNSKLVTENVINWSHFEDKARFTIKVGISYGSDTEKVKEILTAVAGSHRDVMTNPRPVVFFNGFGNSALDFELLFWSKDFLNIEKIKSDIRFEIDKAFRTHGIVIPFPQRDVWIRKEK